MRAIPRSFLAALAAVALIVGCATTPEDQPGAPVTGAKPGAPGGPGAAGVKPGAIGSDPLAAKPVAPVDVTGKPGSGVVDPRVTKGPLAQRSIFYDFDKYDVKDEYRPLVEQHAKYLRENPNARMLIQGNTDERGSREYNIGLGQRRSDGVRRMLILLGANEKQIESVSLGEEKPMVEGSGEDAWAKNRRSDILYGGEF